MGPQRWIMVPEIFIQRGHSAPLQSAKYSCAEGDSNPHSVTH